MVKPLGKTAKRVLKARNKKAVSLPNDGKPKQTTKKTGGAHRKDPDFGMIRLFVYGTLKRGKCNNSLIRHNDGLFLDYDTVTLDSGAFMDLGGFPAAIYPVEGGDANKSQVIRGEIWYGGKDMMKSVDILEGHPLFYRRYKMWTDRLRRRVWIYCLNDSWIQEGEDFLAKPWWKPEDGEREFWERDISADGAATMIDEGGPVQVTTT